MRDEEAERKFFNKQGQHLTGTFLIITSLSHTFTSGQFVLSFNVMMVVSTSTTNKYIKIVSSGVFYFVFSSLNIAKRLFLFHIDPTVPSLPLALRVRRWESQWATINDWLRIVQRFPSNNTCWSCLIVVFFSFHFNWQQLMNNVWRDLKINQTSTSTFPSRQRDDERWWWFICDTLETRRAIILLKSFRRFAKTNIDLEDPSNGISNPLPRLFVSFSNEFQSHSVASHFQFKHLHDGQTSNDEYFIAI